MPAAGVYRGALSSARRKKTFTCMERNVSGKMFVRPPRTGHDRAVWEIGKWGDDSKIPHFQARTPAGLLCGGDDQVSSP